MASGIFLFILYGPGPRDPFLCEEEGTLEAAVSESLIPKDGLWGEKAGGASC